MLQSDNACDDAGDKNISKLSDSELQVTIGGNGEGLTCRASGTVRRIFFEPDALRLVKLMLLSKSTMDHSRTPRDRWRPSRWRLVLIPSSATNDYFVIASETSEDQCESVQKRKSRLAENFSLKEQAVRHCHKIYDSPSRVPGMPTSPTHT